VRRPWRIVQLGIFVVGIAATAVAAVVFSLAAPLALGRWLVSGFIPMPVNDIYPWLSGATALYGAIYAASSVKLTRLALQWRHFILAARRSVQVSVDSMMQKPEK
jgi:hypothetical protein